MAWWEKNNLRLIQNNIMETDAEMNVDNLIKKLKDLSANVLMLNTGGIAAFYPTEFEYHHKSPYLKSDMIGEVIQKCHENDIRFVARFDFSKAHFSIYEKNPEWFYNTQEGQVINYNDMVHTCVNGYYQREYSLKIIEEVITKYPVDGIFFNMFGYQTRDYSSNYYGICHCENCKKRFKEMYGLELPLKEGPSDPVYQKYTEFKEITVREMLDKIHKLVKGINKEIAISTYTDYKVDMIRKESNSAVDRPYPMWLYSASENVKSVEDTWNDKTISNCIINAVDIFYRFQGVSKNLIEMRMYESIASGSGLDFCIIGVFDEYPDYENFEVVKKAFRFHKENEKYFGNFVSAADIILIKPDKWASSDQNFEYLGIFKMLKEQHILFDVICQVNLRNRIEDLGKYKLMIIPDIRHFDDLKFISEAKKNGINIVATNLSFIDNSNDSIFNELFKGKLEKSSNKTRSAYLMTENKEIFKRFPDRNWVFVDGNFNFVKYDNNNRNLLPYIAPARFGPPERCGGYTATEYCGASISKEGGMNISVPWQVGWLYYKYGYEDHKNILLDIIDYALNDSYPLKTNAPKNVEVFFNRYCDGGYILQFLNLTGFNGTTFFEPVDVFDIHVELNNMTKPGMVYSLTHKKQIEFKTEGSQLHITLDKLATYEALIIK